MSQVRFQRQHCELCEEDTLNSRS